MDVVESVRAAVDGRSHPLVPVALRLAGLLDDGGLVAKDAASLSRELRQVLDVLSSEEPADADGVDEVAKRRAARRAASAG